jgi:hypothetical protein
MLFKPTALIYSSHDRCEYIHREFIVRRALENSGNRMLLHLPMSQRMRRGQEWDFSNFRWYYERFRGDGLEYSPFFWYSRLRKSDISLLFEMLRYAQVVVLGGGNSSLGLSRYKALGEMYYRDRSLFGRILHERQDAGLLTAGFSAGADQLCQYLSCAGKYRLRDPFGFGLAGNIMITLHHSPRFQRTLLWCARRFPQCLVFGLLNDSALAVHQGMLPSGAVWQIIHFVIDCSWSVPRHAVHIRSRMGEKIQHFYNDGRHWAFNGGDMLVRIMSPDNLWQRIVIVTASGDYIDYWSQQRAYYRSVQEILDGG